MAASEARWSLTRERVRAMAAGAAPPLLPLLAYMLTRHWLFVSCTIVFSFANVIASIVTAILRRTWVAVSSITASALALSAIYMDVVRLRSFTEHNIESYVHIGEQAIIVSSTHCPNRSAGDQELCDLLPVLPKRASSLAAAVYVVGGADGKVVQFILRRGSRMMVSYAPNHNRIPCRSIATDTYRCGL